MRLADQLRALADNLEQEAIGLKNSTLTEPGDATDRARRMGEAAALERVSGRIRVIALSRPGRAGGKAARS